MILIAESGSTKTNWVTGTKELYETKGFNPLFDSTEVIYAELSKQAGLLKIKDEINKVFFYGASCSSDERNSVVYNALKKYFTKAEVITVDHDLKAAAIATYNGRPGIACILGTGSNSCLFDGQDIHEEVPSLGYVLGDEGSGAYFGKKIVAAYLYHELPEDTSRILVEKYKLEKEEVLTNVYKMPNANVYLARFAKVMNETTDTVYMDKLAEEGFTEFFNHHVKCYKNYQQYPVHFVGSIAFHFKHVLQLVANKTGCELGTVERNPVYDLLAWHLKNA